MRMTDELLWIVAAERRVVASAVIKREGGVDDRTYVYPAQCQERH